MKILFHGGMTFYYRSLLPVIRELVAEGHDIYVLRKGLFLEKRIRNHPRSFHDITKASMKFIATQVGLEPGFIEKINFVWHSKRLGIPTQKLYKKMDMFVSVTKGFLWLNEMARYGKPRVAISYQNYLGTYYTGGNESFPHNTSPEFNAEMEVRKETSVRWQETGLPFMDSYVHRMPTHNTEKTQSILLLHPGGYRDVITRMGESKEKSMEKQRYLYETVLGALPDGLKLVVKIHPLAAKYHDLRFNQRHFSDLGIEFVDGFLGDFLFDHMAILSLGSSALFEILPFKPLWVLNFFSTTRTRIYKSLSSIFINSPDELRHKLTHHQPPKLNEFETAFMERLGKTADGHATDRIVRIIKGLMD